jgi:hypothetical protein
VKEYQRCKDKANHTDMAKISMLGLLMAMSVAMADVVAPGGQIVLCDGVSSAVMEPDYMTNRHTANGWFINCEEGTAVYGLYELGRCGLDSKGLYGCTDSDMEGNLLSDFNFDVELERMSTFVDTASCTYFAGERDNIVVDVNTDVCYGIERGLDKFQSGISEWTLCDCEAKTCTMRNSEPLLICSNGFCVEGQENIGQPWITEHDRSIGDCRQGAPLSCATPGPYMEVLADSVLTTCSALSILSTQSCDGVSCGMVTARSCSGVSVTGDYVYTDSMEACMAYLDGLSIVGCFHHLTKQCSTRQTLTAPGDDFQGFYLITPNRGVTKELKMLEPIIGY